MEPFAIYGKRPRVSKTSKRDALHGIPVFLHSSKAETGGNIVCYWDKFPYPRICVSAGNTYWECRNKLDDFFSKNSIEIQDKLNSLDHNYGIPKDLIDKNYENSGYEIHDKNPNNSDFKMITPYYANSYIPLWVNPVDAPSKNSSGKKIVNSDKVLDEYLRRKK